MRIISLKSAPKLIKNLQDSTQKGIIWNPQPQFSDSFYWLVHIEKHFPAFYLLDRWMDKTLESRLSYLQELGKMICTWEDENRERVLFGAEQWKNIFPGKIVVLFGAEQ